MKQFRSMTYPYVAWISVMIVLPMLLIVLYAFTVSGNEVLTFQFTFDNFKRFVTDTVFMEVLGRSLYIAVLTTLICIALDTDLETWASASAWSLEDGEQVEITDVKYDFDPETIEPGVYDVTFSTEGYEYKVSTTRACEEGAEVGLIFRPEDIHVMKKEGQW